MTGSRGTIYSLQHGRAIAVLAVMAFHLNYWLIGTHNIDILGALAPLTTRAVELFFVISGYIILHVHQRDVGKPEAWRPFVRKRCVRIYPIYWLLTAALLALYLTKPERIPDSLATWASMITLVRFNDAVMPIPPAWTLFHEVAFYALFSLLILSRKLGVRLLGAWLAIGLVSVAFPAPETRTVLSIWASPYNLCFLFGMASKLFVDRLARTDHALLGFAGGIVWIAVSSVLIPDLSPSFGAGFALVLAGAVALERRLKLDLAFGTIVGDASYSIYLTHGFLVGHFYQAIDRAIVVPPIVPFATSLVLTTATGIATYLLVERPMLGLFGKRQGGKGMHVTPLPTSP